jgi:hypothetical protein
LASHNPREIIAKWREYRDRIGLGRMAGKSQSQSPGQDNCGKIS